MNQGILSVTIDEKNSVEVRFEGETTFEIPMLGALSLAKDWLVDKIKSDQNFSSSGESRQEQEEMKVTKTEALHAYLDAHKKIEIRLQAIAASREGQIFRINPEILSKI